MGELANGIGGDAGLALGKVQRVRLNALAIGLEVEGRPSDELGVRQPGVDDLARNRVGEGDVRADVEAEPDVRPLGRARSARVDRVQAGAVADAAQQVMEEDRMGLSSIAAPENDQIGLLDLTI